MSKTKQAIMCDSSHSEEIAKLSKNENLNTIIAQDNIYGALKLIEHLCQIGEVPEHVFKNILLEYGESINPADFKCYRDNN